MHKTSHFFQLKRFCHRVRWTVSFVAIIFLSFSCAAQKNNTSKPYYHEDLNSLRPKTADIVDTTIQTPVRKKNEVIPIHNVNKKVDGVLDSINRFNVARKVIDGYTIQIYSGQNREEAFNTKKKVAADAYDLMPEVEYNQPKFRVKVGGYYSRLDAQKDLLRLKRIFPNAILVPEKIPVH